MTKEAPQPQPPYEGSELINQETGMLNPLEAGKLAEQIFATLQPGEGVHIWAEENTPHVRWGNIDQPEQTPGR